MKDGWIHGNYVSVSTCSLCACATTDVHVRDGVGTSANILDTLMPSDCLPFKNLRGSDDGGASWVNVDFQGEVNKIIVFRLYYLYIKFVSLA